MFSADHPQQPSFQSREEAAASLRQTLEDHRRDNEAWAHWDYSPEEWARFDAIDWKPRLRAALCLLIGLFFGLGLGGAFLFLGAYVLGLLLIGGITALVTPFAFWLSSMMGEDKRRHQARKKPDQPRRVTFAKQGMWVAGVFFTFDNGLKKVRMAARPPVLHFRSFVLLGGYEGPSSVRVLAPRGHEDEAARLAQRYQALLAAEKQRLERFKNPPEPR